MATATQEWCKELDAKLSKLVQEKGLSIDAWNEMRNRRELLLMQHNVGNTDNTRHSVMGKSA
jgi:hypothetical protein